MADPFRSNERIMFAVDRLRCGQCGPRAAVISLICYSRRSSLRALAPRAPANLSRLTSNSSLPCFFRALEFGCTEGVFYTEPLDIPFALKLKRQKEPNNMFFVFVFLVKKTLISVTRDVIMLSHSKHVSDIRTRRNILFCAFIKTAAAPIPIWIFSEHVRCGFQPRSWQRRC